MHGIFRGSGIRSLDGVDDQRVLRDDEMARGRLPQAVQFLSAAWPVLQARFGARSYFGDQCLVHLSRLHEIQGNARAAREYRALLRRTAAAG